MAQAKPFDAAEYLDLQVGREIKRTRFGGRRLLTRDRSEAEPRIYSW